MCGRSVTFLFTALALVSFATSCQGSDSGEITDRDEARDGIMQSFDALNLEAFVDGWSGSAIDFPDIGHPVLDESVEACVQLRTAMESVEAARLDGLITDGAYEARPIEAADRSRAVYEVLVTVHDTPAHASAFITTLFETQASANVRGCSAGMTRDTLRVTTTAFEALAKPAANGKSLALRSVSGTSDRVTEIQMYGWTERNLAVYLFVSAHADITGLVDFQRMVDETNRSIRTGFD